MVVKVMPPES